MTDRPVLTYALRELVWGIESEVAVVGSLTRRIDAHVRTLNVLRAELAARLVGLDRLRAAADDVHLAAFLDRAVVAPLPHLDEDFPDRLYGT